MEPRHKRTLIVVADGARARFFEPRHDTHTLVAAAQAGELDSLLTPQVKKMVSHQIPKDLTGASPPDLWRALEKVLPAAALA